MVGVLFAISMCSVGSNVKSWLLRCDWSWSDCHMEEEAPMWLAAIQGFAALIFGVIGVLGLSALICTLLALAIKAI